MVLGNGTVNTLAQWETKVLELERYSNAINRMTSYRFNVLKLFYVNENVISDLLGHLFDPSASHGQGNYFLLEFLEYLDIQMPLSTKVDVMREKGKIDLLIRSGKFCLIIENKVYNAPDQVRQIDRYIEYASRMHAPENIFIVYLKDGSYPSEVSFKTHRVEFDKRLYCLSVKPAASSTKSLCDFLSRTKSPLNIKLRSFVDDLHNFLVEDDMMNDFRNDIVEWMGESPDRAKSIQIAARYFNDFLNKCLKDFTDKLVSSVRTRVADELGDGFIVEMEPGFGIEKYKGLFLRKPAWKDDYEVRLHHDGYHLMDMFLTIKKSRKGDLLPYEVEFVKSYNSGTCRRPLVSNDNPHVGYLLCQHQIKPDEDITCLLETKRSEIIEEWVEELIDFYNEFHPHVGELCSKARIFTR